MKWFKDILAALRPNISQQKMPDVSREPLPPPPSNQNMSVSAKNGGVAVGGSVSGGTIQIQTIHMHFKDGQVPPQILGLLKQKKGVHILHPRNANFTRRKPLFSDLQSALQSGDKVALTHVQTLTGLGGIGKTQLALEYSYR